MPGMTFIYIAGRYSRRDEFRGVADRLRANHYGVTSVWLSETSPLDTKIGDQSDQFYRATALQDLRDIDDADVVLFFSESEMTPRGGRHVEFGYALAKGKRICVVGPKENVFHFIPGVKHFASLDEFLRGNV